MGMNYLKITPHYFKIFYGILNLEWNILQFFTPIISVRGKDYHKLFGSFQSHLIQSFNTTVFLQF
jgi:hypothetical protein